ncbi:uncharacterized protein LOC119440929 [Dermacentor silvarum]|uniref:uncharacterized protein LOC119440929 n=1 Tax=Dermacentor silvarum TaxID=543639 RepID=UPI0021011078|nr:uncharacterized protein LOC119440929 [Dermacentor silvarum]
MAALCVTIVLWALTATPSEGSVSGCVNITLNDTLDIGRCIGGRLNYCSSSLLPVTNLVTGVTTIVKCVMTGLRQYGSPDGVVNALGPLLQIIGNRLTAVEELGRSTLGNLTLGGTSTAVNMLKNVNTCNGSINILLPGVINMSACILKSLPQVQLMTTITNVACDLQQLLLNIQSSTVGPTVTTILTILSPIFNECGH